MAATVYHRGGQFFTSRRASFFAFGLKYFREAVLDCAPNGARRDGSIPKRALSHFNTRAPPLAERFDDKN
jgi:hypothetical protein